jgi:molybdopterin/thiamine biosynthesis adenylyltransferase/proteasome lid subunit RPN8/RPN11
VGQPLHPPFAAPLAAGVIVARADPPQAPSGSAWLGYAVLHQVKPERYDLIEWLERDESRPLTDQQVRRGVETRYPNAALVVAPAVLLPKAIASEYPRTADDVLALLARQGVERHAVERLLASVTKTNRLLSGQRGNRDVVSGAALYFVIGTPTLGVVGSAERKLHLAVWRVQPVTNPTPRQTLNRRRATPAHVPAQLSGAPALWTAVLDARPGIIARRDGASSAFWLMDKQVMVLGTGALGAPIAIACVRAGVRKIILVDRGFVHPGVLVRQPYDDIDIGTLKVDALARRLRAIAPSVEIEARSDNIVTTMFNDETPPPEVDLIIDATADRAVRTLLERHRTLYRDRWPTTASVLIGHEATHGIATVTRPGASGGGADILRRLGLALRARPDAALTDAVADFFPDPPRTTFFQPEPGCSDVTFVGSLPDVAGLAGQLFAGVLAALDGDEPAGAMHALLVHMPSFPDKQSGAGPRWFHWPNDTVVRADNGRYEVRISPLAAAEMRAEARKGRRVRTARVETGGSLLGAFDTATGVLWIDEATPPPPDSVMSEIYFRHGTEGVADRITARVDATARVTSFVGMWHTHPQGDALPSELDKAGVAQLVVPLPNTPPRASMLILGGHERWEGWLESGAWPESYVTIVEDVRTQPSQSESDLPELPNGMTWWSARHADQGAERPRRRRSWLLRWWPRRRSSAQ